MCYLILEAFNEINDLTNVLNNSLKLKMNWFGFFDSTPREKSQKAIQDETSSLTRQITATVTFLSLLEVSCSFELLIYTDKDLGLPET